VGAASTVIFIVNGVPHCPELGVNVYAVVPGEVVEIVAGDQVPVTPFVEVEGSDPGFDPWQYGPSWVKVGIVPFETVIH